MSETDKLREELRDVRRTIEELRIATYRDNEIVLAVLLAVALAILIFR